MGQLRITKVRRAGRVSIDGLPVTIGRASENAVVLRDVNVSRRHCVIETHEGTPRVRDLGSRHGTKVNGIRVESAPLHEGDRIRVGPFELLFGDPPPADGNGAVNGNGNVDTARGENLEATSRRLAEQAETLAARFNELAAQRRTLDEERGALQREREAAATRLQRAAVAESMIAQCSGHLRQIREIGQRLDVVQRTLRDVEALWLEIDERAGEVEPDGAAAPALLEEREAIADRLEDLHAARERTIEDLMGLLKRMSRELHVEE